MCLHQQFYLTCIFHNQLSSQNRLIYKTVRPLLNFFYLVAPNKPIQRKVSQIVKWTTPIEPFIKLNTDDSSIGNPRMAGAGGLLRDSFGSQILGFSLNMAITSNNVAELGAVCRGLKLAWYLGFKFIHLEIDSMIVLAWLTNENSNFPPHVFPLLCDCKSLMAQAREVQVHHIYREANECADALAKRGDHQQVLTIYETCPSFVYWYYVRDMISLGSNRLCA